MLTFRNIKGMNIIGQGSAIMLFALPSAVIAVALNLYAPLFVKLPLATGILIPSGTGLLVLGIALWFTAVLQLLNDFPKGKLITTGAYGLCRNPIYSSFALFILPGISLLTGTWSYLLISASILIAVAIFIRKEEHNLQLEFGAEYENYLRRVNRILPYLKRQ